MELLTKQTDEAYFAETASRQLATNDLLVSLDGDGSIGKAAVFGGEFDAVCDSHIGALRLKIPKQSSALACLINSTYGQAFVQRHASGATGQIQLAPEDLFAFGVPAVVLENAQEIDAAYRAKLATFRGRSHRIKDKISIAAAAVSDELAGAGGLIFPNRDIERVLLGSSELRDLLNVLKPRMF